MGGQGLPLQGFVTLRQTSPSTARIGVLSAWPGMTGQGIGQRLMQVARVWCQQRGIRRLLVATQTSNLAALRLYPAAAHGWKARPTGFIDNDSIDICPIDNGPTDDGSAGDDMIPFNSPPVVGSELEYMQAAMRSGKLSGDGAFTRRCQQWLEHYSGSCNVLLTPSCTASLEMAALLLNIQPGDEVIMPSYTFVSTANAFVLRGATIVFVDIRPDTLNLDENRIEAAITNKTRAIVVVHYAGWAAT